MHRNAYAILAADLAPMDGLPNLVGETDKVLPGYDKVLIGLREGIGSKP